MFSGSPLGEFHLTSVNSKCKSWKFESLLHLLGSSQHCVTVRHEDEQVIPSNRCIGHPYQAQSCTILTDPTTPGRYALEMTNSIVVQSDAHLDNWWNRPPSLSRKLKIFFNQRTQSCHRIFRLSKMLLKFLVTHCLPWIKSISICARLSSYLIFFLKLISLKIKKDIHINHYSHGIFFRIKLEFLEYQLALLMVGDLFLPVELLSLTVSENTRKLAQMNFKYHFLSRNWIWAVYDPKINFITGNLHPFLRHSNPPPHL